MLHNGSQRYANNSLIRNDGGHPFVSQCQVACFILILVLKTWTFPHNWIGNLLYTCPSPNKETNSYINFVNYRSSKVAAFLKKIVQSQWQWRQFLGKVISLWLCYLSLDSGTTLDGGIHFCHVAIFNHLSFLLLSSGVNWGRLSETGELLTFAEHPAGFTVTWQQDDCLNALLLVLRVDPHRN